jgi:hypothetical protein
MKGIYIFIVALVGFSVANAQEPADALRYSWLTQYGTARNQAIGGAGSSLGGEFSSLFINPAGLGFYNTNEFVITPGFDIKGIKESYLGSPSVSSSNNFKLGASGFLFSSSPERKIRNYSFAFGSNRIADFGGHIFYTGTNYNSSFSEQYLEELVSNNVTDPNQAATDFPFGASQAFNTYLIDTLLAPDGSLAGYKSLANPSYGLIQRNDIKTSGGITDISFGGGFNLKDKLYFGASLSFPFLNYNRDGNYKESDASGNPNNNFNYFEANETLNTKGVGIASRLGVIYRPKQDVRLGLSFQTPTLYELTDLYSMDIITDMEGYGGAGIKEQSSLDLNGGQLLESRYNLVTPLRATLSGSWIVREVQNVQDQHGFISGDIEYVNYKGMAFKAANSSDTASKNYYSSLNKVMDNIYRNTVNIRLGGELKFNTYMLRLGGAFYGNPYRYEKASLYTISGGVGYRNHGIYVDLTYVYTFSRDVNYPYLLADKPNNPAYLKKNYSNIIATAGLKF